MDLLVRAPRAIVDGAEQAVDVGIADGRIACVQPWGTVSAAGLCHELDEDVVLLPGFVDSHVHINDPGHSDWESFASATMAAAAAGLTTLVDMPLDSVPVTTTPAALRAKRLAATGQCRVDVGFWAGAVPENLGSLDRLHNAGVLGFKAFLTDSGTADFAPLSNDQLTSAMSEIAGLGSRILVHAESDEELSCYQRPSGRSYQSFLDSRPNPVEDRAVSTVIEAARQTGARAHIVHLSSASALPLLAVARREGDVLVTAETCPHYLSLSAAEVPDGATEFAACPPIRDNDNQELLWQALANGLIDTVVSDHSPCSVELKHLGTGDFGLAWAGISSLQLGPSRVWTSASARGFALTDLVRWMSSGPASCAGLQNKGSLAVGGDADFVVFDPDAEFVVDAARLHHRQAITPYAGQKLRGRARATWLRGRCVFSLENTPERNHGIDSASGPPIGRLLNRDDQIE
ncbi:allantoinase AllB [Jatrophihabitans sp. DSM 45814]